SRLATGKGLARRLLAEYPAVVFRADPIVVEAGHTADRPFSDGEAVGLQFVEARPKAWGDIAFQDFCRPVDVGLPIIPAEAAFHAVSLLGRAHLRYDHRSADCNIQNIRTATAKGVARVRGELAGPSYRLPSGGWA